MSETTRKTLGYQVMTYRAEDPPQTYFALPIEIDIAIPDGVVEIVRDGNVKRFKVDEFEP